MIRPYRHSIAAMATASVRWLLDRIAARICRAANDLTQEDR